MSINSSSSLHTTLEPPSFHPSDSSMYIECLKFIASKVIYTVYTFINFLLLLPLYILILYMGFQRWRHPHSVPAAQSTSHSDFFTFHMVLVELLGVFGSFFNTLGMYISNVTMLVSGMFLSCVIFPGHTLFHLLTCVERYLAVVHPITYMHLRERGGVRIRNISIACTWLLCFGWMVLTGLYYPEFPTVPLFCMLSFSLIVISLCCLSVLCVLTHSWSGANQIDQPKQRAFYIICAILFMLLLRFVKLLVASGLYMSESILLAEICVLMDCGMLLSVPSSLVLPLLFLHKAEKLPCCKRSTAAACG